VDPMKLNALLAVAQKLTGTAALTTNTVLPPLTIAPMDPKF